MDKSWMPHNVKSLLGGRVLNPLPAKAGCYKIEIVGDKFRPRKHGPSRIIYIGRAKGGGRSSLRKRVGLFLGAALGFDLDHSGGKRFYEMRREHGLSVMGLRVSVKTSRDPQCLEVRLFEEFAKKHEGIRPYLCRRTPSKRCDEHERHSKS
jgi:hypothetical protein